VISQTADEAKLTAESEDGRMRYQVTLRKYAWLLPTAKNDLAKVIWLPASVELTECAAKPN
jgi:hypothetical protein